MDAQEELESYEETMRRNCESGKERVPTELSEIDRIKALQQNSLGSAGVRSYYRVHQDQ